MWSWDISACFFFFIQWSICHFTCLLRLWLGDPLSTDGCIHSGGIIVFLYVCVSRISFDCVKWPLNSRFLNKLKKTVKNKARVEGSICQAYLAKEFAQFSSFYFPGEQEESLHGDSGPEDTTQSNSLSVFRKIEGRPYGRCTTRNLTDQEIRVAHLHILLNCDEVKPLYVWVLQNKNYTYIINLFILSNY